MGMFDYVKCKYPLPMPEMQENSFQTKDFESMMDLYEIREDGTLWHESYDVEDHSDPNATGLLRLRGMLSRVNKRWEQLDYHGDIYIYDFDKEPPTVIDSNTPRDWKLITFRVRFTHGKVESIERMD